MSTHTCQTINCYYDQVKQTVVFLWMMLIYSTLIELPWAVYVTFVLEEKHGFNKQVSLHQSTKECKQKF